MTITLGAFTFKANNVVIGKRPRTIITAANVLAAEPVQVAAYYSDFMQVRISGVMEGQTTQGESAEAHLARMRSNLKTEVGKNSNVLTIVWPFGEIEAYRVKMNEDYDEPLEWHISGSYVADYEITLNCLPYPF